MRRYAAELGLPAADEVEVVRVTLPDEVGMEHVVLQQRHAALPVRFGQLTVHLDNR